MKVLGIETSCDETAAAVVADDRRILSNVVFSQIDDHREFGGVVPEIAARAHLDHLDGIVDRALQDADMTFEALDGIAATGGPGLIGGVIVGTMTAKAIAAATGKPYIAVNHLEGHALTARLTDDVAFPYLLLLVSGGHCQLLAVDGVGQYRPLGSTVDDAVGEAFDKTAKLLGLGFPGGPAVEQAALSGNPAAFALPRPMKGRSGCDFSFSGLKTAVRHAAMDLALTPETVADLAASFQQAVAEVLVDRTRSAIRSYGSAPPATLVIAGGVAANRTLRGALSDMADEEGVAFAAPPLELCTDNGAMIAWAGLERLRLQLVDGMNFAPRPRWPLAELSGG